MDEGYELKTSTNGNKAILCILPRGEAIRNFAYTGALDLLQPAFGRTILSVKPSEDIWEYLGNQCHDLRLLRDFKDRYPVRILRELLDLAHGRWLWSEAAQERWRLRDLEAVTAGQKMKRWGKKAAICLFANRRGLNLLSSAERATSRLLQTTQYYVNLFRELQPSLVFNCSHVHGQNAIQAVQAAQWLGIPTATFIFSWDNLTSQGRIMPPYDYYLVWNEAIRDQLLDIYDSIRPEQVFVTGTPQFDFHFKPEFFWTREKFCAHTGADPSRPIVLYTTGMANHMPGEPQIVEGIADLLREMTDLNSPQLLLRVYPKDQTGRFEDLKRRRPDILFSEPQWDPEWLTPRIEDCYLLTNTLRHADLGINVASTITLELCMFDKPVINVGYNPPSVEKSIVDYSRYYKFDHYRPVVESGCVMLAKSVDDMREMLRRTLTKPQATKKQRQDLIRNMFGAYLDGGSSRRVAECLIKLAGNSQAKQISGSIV